MPRTYANVDDTIMVFETKDTKKLGISTTEFHFIEEIPASDMDAAILEECNQKGYADR